MTENSDDVLKSIREGLEKKLNEVKEEILEELQLIRARLDEVEMKKKPNVLEKTEQIDTLKGAPMDSSFAISGKQFVLKHTFKNVLNIKKEQRVFSSKEEHFGVSWSMHIVRKEDFLEFYTSCSYSATSDNASITTELEVKVRDKKGETKNWESVDVYEREETEILPINWGWPDFIKWDKLENDYLIDGNLTIEATFKITKMTGIYKEDLRNFDESTKDVSDITLIVNEKKFYVAKLFLAAHSSYFKTLFLGQFNESEKSEITLTGIDSDDFQKYLEVLYGESAIDEFTVEGLLLLADMYDTNLVIRKCQEFLLKDSKKTLKTKLRIAFRYNLDELKKNCLSEIKTIENIRSVIAGDINDMDPSVTSALLGKCISFNQ